MKVSRVFGPVLASCLLAGCFEADQDLIVEKDGSATFRTRMAMEASLLQMPEADQDFCVEEDVPDVEGISLKQERYSEGNMEVCLVTAEGPLDRMAEWIEQADHHPAGADGEVSEGPTITLKRDGSDYIFSVHLESSALDMGGSEEMMEEMKPMILAAFGDRALGWSVTAPEIKETNGQLSEDGTTASYSIPLVSLMEGSGTEHSFEVRFATSSPGLLKRLLGN